MSIAGVFKYAMGIGQGSLVVQMAANRKPNSILKN